MFGLKLPSELKKGAAEEEHSLKKARGELHVPLDPEAGMAWKKNKGGPVWGVKGETVSEQKKEASMKLKPAWSTQPAQSVHGAADLSKSKPDQIASQNPPPVRLNAWGITPAVETRKVDKEPTFQGNAWADEVEAEESSQNDASTAHEEPTLDLPAVTTRPTKPLGRYSGFAREDIEERNSREAPDRAIVSEQVEERGPREGDAANAAVEAQCSQSRETVQECEHESNLGPARWQEERLRTDVCPEIRASDRLSERLGERSLVSAPNERFGFAVNREPRSSESPRSSFDKSFPVQPFERGGLRERGDDSQRQVRTGTFQERPQQAPFSSRTTWRPDDRDRFPAPQNISNYRDRGCAADRSAGSVAERSTDRFDDFRRDESGQRGHVSRDVEGRFASSDVSSRFGVYRPPLSVFQGTGVQRASNRPNVEMDPTNPNPADGRGPDPVQDDMRRPRSISLMEEPRPTRKEMSRELSWKKESPREDANPTIQSSPSESPSIHPSSGVISTNSEKDSDWCVNSTREQISHSGFNADEDQASLSAAVAAPKPPMMILKRPTPPSTPSATGRQGNDQFDRPPSLALSPSKLSSSMASSSICTHQKVDESKDLRLNSIEVSHPNKTPSEVKQVRFADVKSDDLELISDEVGATSRHKPSVRNENSVRDPESLPRQNESASIQLLKRSTPSSSGAVDQEHSRRVEKVTSGRGTRHRVVEQTAVHVHVDDNLDSRRESALQLNRTVEVDYAQSTDPDSVEIVESSRIILNTQVSEALPHATRESSQLPHEAQFLAAHPEACIHPPFLLVALPQQQQMNPSGAQPQQIQHLQFPFFHHFQVPQGSGLIRPAGAPQLVLQVTSNPAVNDSVQAQLQHHAHIHQIIQQPPAQQQPMAGNPALAQHPIFGPPATVWHFTPSPPPQVQLQTTAQPIRQPPGPPPQVQLQAVAQPTRHPQQVGFPSASPFVERTVCTSTEVPALVAQTQVVDSSTRGGDKKGGKRDGKQLKEIRPQQGPPPPQQQIHQQQQAQQQQHQQESKKQQGGGQQSGGGQGGGKQKQSNHPGQPAQQPAAAQGRSEVENDRPKQSQIHKQGKQQKQNVSDQPEQRNNQKGQQQPQRKSGQDGSGQTNTESLQKQGKDSASKESAALSQAKSSPRPSQDPAVASYAAVEERRQRRGQKATQPLSGAQHLASRSDSAVSHRDELSISGSVEITQCYQVASAPQAGQPCAQQVPQANQQSRGGKRNGKQHHETGGFGAKGASPAAAEMIGDAASAVQKVQGQQQQQQRQQQHQSNSHFIPVPTQPQMPGQGQKGGSKSKDSRGGNAGPTKTPMLEAEALASAVGPRAAKSSPRGEPAPDGSKADGSKSGQRFYRAGPGGGNFAESRAKDPAVAVQASTDEKQAKDEKHTLPSRPASSTAAAAGEDGELAKLTPRERIMMQRGRGNRSRGRGGGASGPAEVPSADGFLCGPY